MDEVARRAVDHLQRRDIANVELEGDMLHGRQSDLGDRAPTSAFIGRCI
ncbi:MAG: hypothetical protein R2710_02925 [Acidimicrobiales bacterium]